MKLEPRTKYSGYDLISHFSAPVKIPAPKHIAEIEKRAGNPEPDFWEITSLEDELSYQVVIKSGGFFVVGKPYIKGGASCYEEISPTNP